MPPYRSTTLIAFLYVASIAAEYPSANVKVEDNDALPGRYGGNGDKSDASPPFLAARDIRSHLSPLVRTGESIEAESTEKTASKSFTTKLSSRRDDKVNNSSIERHKAFLNTDESLKAASHIEYNKEGKVDSAQDSRLSKMRFFMIH